MTTRGGRRGPLGPLTARIHIARILVALGARIACRSVGAKRRPHPRLRDLGDSRRDHLGSLVCSGTSVGPGP